MFWDSYDDIFNFGYRLINALEEYKRIDKYLCTKYLDSDDDKYKKILEKQRQLGLSIITSIKKKLDKWEMLLDNGFIEHGMYRKENILAEKKLIEQMENGELYSYIKLDEQEDPEDKWFDEWSKAILREPLDLD